MPWKEDNNKSFINPYNFISVYGKCKKDNNIKEIVKDRKLISGVIDCTLIAKTPIFIPNTTSKNALHVEGEDKDHKSYDFFSYEDLNEISDKDVKEPVIPGSSIRGTIRAIYEALTNSCFSVIDDKRILSKRMPDASKPGVIRREDNKYVLYDSEKFMAKYKECKNDPNGEFDKKDYSNGQRVLFKPGSKYKKKGRKRKPIDIGTVVEDIIPYDTKEQHEVEDYKEGYILLGGVIGNKHHFSIISAEVNQKDFIREMDDLDNLKNVIALYKDNLEKGNKKLEKEFSDYERKINLLENGKTGAIPVFYKKVESRAGTNDGFIYLSPSCITREVYYNTIEKILKDMENYNPCDDINKLCDACSLFGMVGQEANSSRIRFTDGRYKSNENGIYDDIVTLQELATPRISSTEFYMKSPREELKDAEIWTFDYAAKWDRSKKIKLKGFKPELRGRKIYWHHRNGLTMKNNKRNNMNVTIRPAKKGVKFEFKVFFDRITKDELNKLVWVLNLGENNEKSNYCHKMGMGKPLGLGSVKIVVNSVKKRFIDLDTLDNVYKYENIEINPPKFNDDVLREVKVVTNLNSVKGTISYPKATDKKGKKTIYDWFIVNKCFNGGNRFKPKINKTLCKVTEKNLTLPSYKEIGRNKNKNSGRSSFVSKRN